MSNVALFNPSQAPAFAPDVSRVFYAKAYDGEVSAPDCWSQDGKTPSPEASNPQHNKCDGCEQNIAGSGQNNSRACRYQQHIAVVLANDMEGAVLKLTVPAKSVFGKEEGDNRALQAYARHLGAQNIDPSEVITRMKFDTKSEAPKLFFKAMRWLTDDEFPIIQEQGKTDTAKRPAPVVEEEEAPAPAPKAKTKAKAAPLPAEEDEEPVVRKEEKKPNAVPKAKADLSAMVDDWDEAE